MIHWGTAWRKTDLHMLGTMDTNDWGMAQWDPHLCQGLDDTNGWGMAWWGTHLLMLRTRNAHD